MANRKHVRSSSASGRETITPSATRSLPSSSGGRPCASMSAAVHHAERKPAAAHAGNRAIELRQASYNSGAPSPAHAGGGNSENCCSARAPVRKARTLKPKLHRFDKLGIMDPSRRYHGWKLLCQKGFFFVFFLFFVCSVFFFFCGFLFGFSLS